MAWWVYVAIALGIFTAGATTGWQTRDWKSAADERDRLADGAKVARDDAKRIDRAAEKFQTGQAAADARETVVFKEVIRVIQKPIYREQCFDDDGLRILADDIRSSNTLRGFATAVPASGPASGAVESRPAAVVP